LNNNNNNNNNNNDDDDDFHYTRLDVKTSCWFVLSFRQVMHIQRL